MELVGPPTAFPVWAPVHRGCPAWTHRWATESRVTLWQRANPLLCVVGVATSCVPCARARGRTSRSCATENSLPPLLDWKRWSSSQSSPFSVVRIISTKFSEGCGCSLQLIIFFEISSDSSCMLSAVSQFRLVHANANLCPFSVDFARLSNAVASVFGCHCDLRDVTIRLP